MNARLSQSSPKPVKSLEGVTHDFTDCLRRHFAQQISHNPRDYKKQVLRLIRRQLPPHRGRPTRPQIEAALEMLRQGKTVREVLRAQVRGFEQLDTWGRMLAEKALRQALARRRQHHGNKSRFHAPKSSGFRG